MILCPTQTKNLWIHSNYTHKKLTVAYVDCVTWFNIWGARIGSTFQGNLEEWCIKFLFSLCTTCKRRRKKNEMSGLLNCCFMTGFKSIKLFTGTDNDMPGVPKLKVSKSWKQFMVSSILPKCERNSLSWASFLLRIVSFVCFLGELRTP